MRLLYKYLYRKSVGGFFAILLLRGAAGAGIANGADTAGRALELFCKNEFIGEVPIAWADYGRYSQEGEKYAKEIRGEGEPPSLLDDPIVIVSTYCISGIQMYGDSGVGRVVFERLAYTIEKRDDVNFIHSREIIPEYNESDEVEYNLKKINGRWYVFNPAIMRVSVAAINKYYFGQVTSFLPDDFWTDPKFSNEQRKNIAKEFSDLGILMQVSTDYLKRLENRYKTLGGPGYPDRERRQRVKGNYNGKWNLEIIPDDNH